MTEADVFAEIVLEALRGAGLAVKCGCISRPSPPFSLSPCRYSRACFDGRDVQLQPPLSWQRAGDDADSVYLWVEPGSTHTG